MLSVLSIPVASIQLSQDQLSLKYKTLNFSLLYPSIRSSLSQTVQTLNSRLPQHFGSKDSQNHQRDLQEKKIQENTLRQR